MSEVLVKYDEAINAPDGSRYFAQASGNERSDGLWEGWLEFVPVNEDTKALASERETTQPNRTNLKYWAEGLTKVYLEGALQRAVSLVGERPQAQDDRPERSRFDAPAVRARDNFTDDREIPRHPILDPYSVYSQGEHILRGELGALSRDHVESIAAAYGFAPKDSAADLAHIPDQRLIDAIVDGVRSSEGERPSAR